MNVAIPQIIKDLGIAAAIGAASLEVWLLVLAPARDSGSAGARVAAEGPAPA